MKLRPEEEDAVRSVSKKESRKGGYHRLIFFRIPTSKSLRGKEHPGASSRTIARNDLKKKQKGDYEEKRLSRSMTFKQGGSDKVLLKESPKRGGGERYTWSCRSVGKREERVVSRVGRWKGG